MAIQALVIGYGAIAHYVATSLRREDPVRVRWVVTRPGREEQARAVFGPEIEPVSSIDALDAVPEIALECAGHEAVREHAPALLRRGVELGIVSVGALTGPDLIERLDKAANEGRGQLRVLSGAVGALDALAAAREGGLDRVIYSGIKPPGAWRGSPAEDVCDLDNLDQATAFFEGTARAAASQYPKNANVAATVALAGLGLDETAVRLVADPDAPGNIHRFEAEGQFGNLSFEIQGRALPDNPRSSALTAMSALRFLRSAGSRIVV